MFSVIIINDGLGNFHTVQKVTKIIITALAVNECLASKIIRSRFPFQEYITGNSWAVVVLQCIDRNN